MHKLYLIIIIYTKIIADKRILFEDTYSQSKGFVNNFLDYTHKFYGVFQNVTKTIVYMHDNFRSNTVGPNLAN